LLVEQNAYAALHIANQGYVLETGRVVLQGSGFDLRQNEEVRHSYLGR
jgi:branched-chain amino acid transport system ATP-binding protein